MNEFAAHMDLFYEIRKDFMNEQNYEAALAMDSVIDRFDDLMKGKAWAVGMAAFTDAIKQRELAAQADEKEAYRVVLDLL